MIVHTLAMVGTGLALAVLLLMGVSAVLFDLSEGLGSRGKRSP